MKTVNSKNLPDFYEFGPYRFDARDHLLFKNGEEAHLTPKVAEILLVLLKHHGHLVEKEYLMQEVWPDTVVEENNLTRNISTLRKMLSECEEDEYIETIPCRGYRFVSQVREVNEAPPVMEVIAPVYRVPEIETVSVSPATFNVNVTPPEIIATIEGVMTPQPAQQEKAKIGAPGIFKYGQFRLLFNGMLLVVITALLFWQIKSLYRLPQSSDRETATELFSQLRLNRHPAKGMPLVAELSPDGKYIAYAASDETGLQSLYLSQVNTNNAKRIVPPADAKYLGLNFAPGGGHLYFARREENQGSVLYRLPMLSDEPPQRLAALGSSSPIGLSPDGSRIAFIREQAAEGVSALITANTDGSAERKHVQRRFPDFFPLTGSPSWSPNGKILVCVVGNLADGVRYQLANIELEHDSALTIHHTQWPWIYQVAWLPNGREVLLLADEQPGGWRDQLWLMTWPEGRLKRLTNDLNDYSGISPAADSGSLVTVQSNQLSDIWIVPHQSGKRSQRMTSFNDRREGLRGLDWTPDGHLLFTSLESGRDQIWSMHTDGSQRCDLTLRQSADSNNYSPSSSPDGNQVVFVSDRQGKTRIWRMNIDGSQPQPLTEGHDDLDPQVSADGLWVVYSSTKSGIQTLWKVPLAGGAETQVTDLPTEAPVVSPTSNLVVCTKRETGANSQRKLAIIDLESRQAPRYFTLPDESTWIRWMPHGKALSYQMLQNGIPNLWSHPLGGGQSTRITDLSFENVASFAWSRDGKRLALVRVQEIRSVVFINGLK